MKKMKKSLSALLVLACSLAMLFTAIPAFAATKELDEAAKQNLGSVVSGFLGEIYKESDENIAQLGESGGFYEVLAESWKENKDIVGDLVEVGTPAVTQDSDGVVATTPVKFENYETDVVIYFDEAGQTPKNYVMNIHYSLGELMKQAAENMVVGLITVFAILVILIVIIYLFRFIPDPSKKVKKAQSDEKAPQAAPAAAGAAPAAAPTAAASAVSSDTEIAAVIAAALAAAMEENPSASGYVVRSVRKVDSRRWKRV